MVSQRALLRHQCTVLQNRCFGGLGDKRCVRNSNTNNNIVNAINVCVQKCATSIFQHLSYVCRNASHVFPNICHLSYAFYAFENKIAIIMHTNNWPSTSNNLNNILCVNPPWPLTSIGSPWSRISSARRPQHRGLSMRDGKPMGTIEAPMVAIGCCKKMFREPPGKICIRNSDTYNRTVNYI